MADAAELSLLRTTLPLTMQTAPRLDYSSCLGLLLAYFDLLAARFYLLFSPSSSVILQLSRS
jgi:hypothetical protein